MARPAGDQLDLDLAGAPLVPKRPACVSVSGRTISVRATYPTNAVQVRRCITGRVVADDDVDALLGHVSDGGPRRRTTSMPRPKMSVATRMRFSKPAQNQRT